MQNPSIKRGSAKNRVPLYYGFRYDGLFDDLFERYTTAHTLEKVKTTNMGTLYELHYRINLRQEPVSKSFLDELRCRNGNLTIVCCREETHESL